MAHRGKIPPNIVTLSPQQIGFTHVSSLPDIASPVKDTEILPFSQIGMQKATSIENGNNFSNNRAEGFP